MSTRRPEHTGKLKQMPSKAQQTRVSRPLPPLKANVDPKSLLKYYEENQEAIVEHMIDFQWKCMFKLFCPDVC